MVRNTVAKRVNLLRPGLFGLMLIAGRANAQDTLTTSVNNDDSNNVKKTQVVDTAVVSPKNQKDITVYAGASMPHPTIYQESGLSESGAFTRTTYFADFAGKAGIKFPNGFYVQGETFLFATNNRHFLPDIQNKAVKGVFAGSAGVQFNGGQKLSAQFGSYGLPDKLTLSEEKFMFNMPGDAMIGTFMYGATRTREQISVTYSWAEDGFVHAGVISANENNWFDFGFQNPGAFGFVATPVGKNVRIIAGTEQMPDNYDFIGGASVQSEKYNARAFALADFNAKRGLPETANFKLVYGVTQDLYNKKSAAGFVQFVNIVDKIIGVKTDIFYMPNKNGPFSALLIIDVGNGYNYFSAGMNLRFGAGAQGQTTVKQANDAWKQYQQQKRDRWNEFIQNEQVDVW